MLLNPIARTLTRGPKPTCAIFPPDPVAPHALLVLRTPGNPGGTLKTKVLTFWTSFVKKLRARRSATHPHPFSPASVANAPAHGTQKSALDPRPNVKLAYGPIKVE
jgi:hypothetical protein